MYKVKNKLVELSVVGDNNAAFPLRVNGNDVTVLTHKSMPLYLKLVNTTVAAPFKTRVVVAEERGRHPAYDLDMQAGVIVPVAVTHNDQLVTVSIILVLPLRPGEKQDTSPVMYSTSPAYERLGNAGPADSRFSRVVEEKVETLTIFFAMKAAK